MTTEILEQFRKLNTSDQRELLRLMQDELAHDLANYAHKGRQSIIDITGKYRPHFDDEVASHDAGFTDAISASKLASPPWFDRLHFS